MADLTQFEIGSARRIARVVRQVEQEPRRAKPLSFTPVAQNAPRRQITFRICTFTGQWSINSEKTVQFKYQAETPNTVNATNLFWPIPEGSGGDCSIAQEGTSWYLVTPKLFAIDAVTAATFTSSALVLDTVPVVAFANVGNKKFVITPPRIDAITDVTLGSDSLSFTRKSIGVFFESTASTVSVSVTTCSTAAV